MYIFHFWWKLSKLFVYSSKKREESDLRIEDKESKVCLKSLLIFDTLDKIRVGVYNGQINDFLWKFKSNSVISD
jgi:hypothetical protein